MFRRRSSASPSRSGHLRAGRLRHQRRRPVHAGTCSTASSGASRAARSLPRRGSRWRWPTRRSGIFAHVVLVPDDAGRGCVLGFTSGHAIEGDPGLSCVFVPSSPNPTTGKLYFVPDHPLHPPRDEPAGRAQADHLGRQLRARRASARGRSAATRCPASGDGAIREKRPRRLTPVALRQPTISAAGRAFIGDSAIVCAVSWRTFVLPSRNSASGSSSLIVDRLRLVVHRDHHDARAQLLDHARRLAARRR